ncbi:putative phospholipase protein [Collimonas arenae]|uniref:Putative phospholipase protein n=1 Tax=Collimonas arenae TaxID=279058 RepID=A0A0A1F7P2_9BURK|nr:phospholipase D-like domain-containing protein [Collimonas arenae]AIY40551.1 putative phospholipase protein [Collimonas arenae]
MTQQQSIVVPIALSRTNTATLTLPWFVQRTEYLPAPATYKPLVNGEEAFGAVYDAILAAQHTVDIICWGFQPSMQFKRGPGVSALCIGDLLIKKGREGVKIRLLCWADFLHLAQASENSTPGDGFWRSLSTQNENNTQREYDRNWYYQARAAGSPEQQEFIGNLRATTTAHSQDVSARPQLTVPPLKNIQVGTRDFSLSDRAEIVYRELMHRSDKDLSKIAVVGSFGLEPSHHQKMILVDYEAPEQALGFVMGHNTLDTYWDNDAHGYARMHPNFGRNGETPRQDMSSLVTGPVLAYLNENFCQAWKRTTNVDLLSKRKPLASALKVRRDMGTAVMAQITRTQSQEGKQDIKTLYLQAANNATQFIYIENQYFRWSALATQIKAIAKRHVEWGRDPGQDGPIHLFVVTNSSDEGMGDGTVSTYNMLNSLGRADVIPGVARLERDDQLLAQRDAAQQQLERAQMTRQYVDSDKQVQMAQQKLDTVNQQLSENKKAIIPMEIPGLKVHVCTLVAPDSPADAWMPVYVHSKIMIVDDVFLTHGSANINVRSMEVDSELNICHENAAVTHPLRRRLWNIHTKGLGAQDKAVDAFKTWRDIIQKNSDRQASKVQSPYASLVGFYRASTKRSRLD